MKDRFARTRSARRSCSAARAIRAWFATATTIITIPTTRILSVDIYGDEVETVTAPARGVFVRSTTLSTVSRGERAATLGLL